MNSQGLHGVFAATLESNINARAQAELTLRELEVQPGFINGCLDIVLEPQVSMGVKKAAGVYLKNKVQRCWYTKDESSPKRIDPDEKPVFRERLVPALVQAPVDVRPVLATVLNDVVASDYPQQWPQLLDIAIQLIQNGEADNMRAGLTCLLQITRSYKWRSGEEERKLLDALVQTAFPSLPQIGHQLIAMLKGQNGGSQDPASIATLGDMLKDVVKIYKMAIYTELPEVLQHETQLNSWVELFLQVIRMPYPASMMAIDEDDRDLHPLAKAKKWASFDLYRLMAKYAGKSSGSTLTEKDQKYKKFSEGFSQSGAAQSIVHTYLQQLQDWVNQTQWMSEAELFYVISFLEECIAPKWAWPYIKPHIETLITGVMFPCMCISEKTLETFETDPEEYIHRCIDIYEDSMTSETAATNFVLLLVRKRKSYVFSSILQFVQSVVQDYAQNSRDLGAARRKEGALKMMGTISYLVLSKKSPVSHEQMEQFLAQWVFPDFDSEFPFLRARALETLNRYADVPLSQTNVQTAYQAIMRLMGDEDNLPVQVEACLVLQPMIRHDDVREAVSPRIPSVMTHFLELTAKIDMDALTGVMEEFVEIFSQQLTPFAIQLATQMRDQFMRLASEIAEKANVDPDDFNESDLVGDDKIMAALGILNTLTSLLMALDNSTDIVEQLEQVFFPIYQLVLQQQMIDFYAETFQLMENSTFCLKRITPTMWQTLQLVPQLFHNGDFDGYDFLQDCQPTLTNYILYGAQEIASNSEIAAVFCTIYRDVVSDRDRLGASDRVLACELAITLLESLKRLNLQAHSPMVSEALASTLVPLAMQRLVGQEQQLKEPYYVINLLEVVIAAIYYDAAATLQVLESQQWTEQFFQQWFVHIQKNSFGGRVCDIKLCIAAILELLTLPDNMLPAVIGQSIPQITKSLVGLAVVLPRAIEKRDELRKEFSSDDFSGANAGLDDIYGADEWSDDEEGEGGAEDGLDNDTAAMSSKAQEYLQYLETADKDEYNELLKDLDAHAAQVYGADDDDDDEYPEEEVLAESPMDEYNAYVAIRDTFLSISQSSQARYQQMTGQFTEDDARAVDLTVARANEAT